MALSNSEQRLQMSSFGRICPLDDVFYKTQIQLPLLAFNDFFCFLLNRTLCALVNVDFAVHGGLF